MRHHRISRGPRGKRVLAKLIAGSYMPLCLPWHAVFHTHEETRRLYEALPDTNASESLAPPVGDIPHCPHRGVPRLAAPGAICPRQPLVPRAHRYQGARGDTPFLWSYATGTQNYICLLSDSGFAWAFFGPQATLFDDDKRQIITHFLSPNRNPRPEEKGMARATWQDSEDTSVVWAKMIASSERPLSEAGGDSLAAAQGGWSGHRAHGGRPAHGDQIYPAGVHLGRSGASYRLCSVGGRGHGRWYRYTADYIFYKRE